MFTRKLPRSLISHDNQILLDKREIEDLEHLKVDILANRGLSQLLEIDPNTPLTDYPESDERTAALLCRGDILGVTQGESPAMRRLFRAIQPKSVHDCVFATAMIRPVATSGRQRASIFQDWSRETLNDSIVFEDDAIEIISSIIGVDHYEADQYRRAFAKKNDEKIIEFVERLGNNPKKSQAIAALQELSGFGLCRAHAVNLGRLIWALAYCKAHNPEQFWRANLKHCEGSYRSWVYQTEAHRRGIETKPGWWQKGFPKNLGIEQRFLERVNFAGVIANGRCFRGSNNRWVTFLTLGSNYGEYFDITVQRPIQYHDGDIVAGSGVVRHNNGSDYINCIDAKLYTFAEWNRLHRLEQ